MEDSTSPSTLNRWRRLPCRSPWYTLLLPLRILPYTDGRSWARREGLERHQGVRMGEELTDESEDEEYED